MIDQTIWALMRKVSHHNSKLAREARLREDIANNQIPPQVQELPWDCDPVRLGEECPLDRRCRAEKDGVYSAKVTRLDDNTSETYTGMHKGEFKGRWYAHRQNISHRNQRTNSRDGVFGHCPHKREHLLNKIKGGVTWTNGPLKKLLLSFNTSYHFNTNYVNFWPQNWKHITVSDESLRMKQYCNTVNFIMKLFYWFDKYSITVIEYNRHF